MIALTENQVLFVQNILAESDLKYKPLQEELLDHLCCGIEENMVIGIPFAQAVPASFERFGVGEFERIEQQTLLFIKYKNSIMKKLPVLILLVVLFSISIGEAIQQEPPSISPIKGDAKISSTYGMRVHPLNKEKKLHRGIDFKVSFGTAVLATSDGIIVEAGDKNDNNGLKIVIKHDDVYQTAYCHLSGIDVKVGQKVKKGEIIGAVGNSGASTAPHLHYEVLANGEYVNPEAFMKP